MDVNQTTHKGAINTEADTHTKGPMADAKGVPSGSQSTISIFNTAPEKKPMNSYLLFNQEQRVRLTAQNPELSTGDISRQIGDMWRAKTKEERAPYVKRAKEIYREYKAIHPEYLMGRRKKGNGPLSTAKKPKVATDAVLSPIATPVYPSSVSSPVDPVEMVGSSESNSTSEESSLDEEDGVVVGEDGEMLSTSACIETMQRRYLCHDPSAIDVTRRKRRRTSSHGTLRQRQRDRRGPDLWHIVATLAPSAGDTPLRAEVQAAEKQEKALREEEERVSSVEKPSMEVDEGVAKVAKTQRLRVQPSLMETHLAQQTLFSWATYDTGLFSDAEDSLDSDDDEEDDDDEDDDDECDDNDVFSDVSELSNEEDRADVTLYRARLAYGLRPPTPPIVHRVATWLRQQPKHLPPRRHHRYRQDYSTTSISTLPAAATTTTTTTTAAPSSSQPNVKGLTMITTADGKQIKDPNAPKHPAPAFLFYLRAQRPLITAENPSLAQRDVPKVAGERWRALTDAGKAPYVAKAMEERVRYREEMKVYRERRYGDGSLASGESASPGYLDDAGKGFSSSGVSSGATTPGAHKPQTVKATTLDGKPKRPTSPYLHFMSDVRGEFGRKFAIEQAAAVVADGRHAVASIPAATAMSVTKADGMGRMNSGQTSIVVSPESQGQTAANISRAIAARWRALSEEERRPYMEMGEVDQRRYRKEMELWKRGGSKGGLPVGSQDLGGDDEDVLSIAMSDDLDEDEVALELQGIPAQDISPLN